MTNDEYYKFEKDHAYEFARAIGRATGIKSREKGDELQFVFCPYCHGGKNHDKNTFAINLKTGMFNCLRSSCSVKGNMLTLAKDFEQFQLPRDVSTYYNIGSQPKYRHFNKPEKPVKPKDPAIEYLKSRGISEEITKKYEVTNKGKDTTLMFLFRDENDEVQFIKYRNTDHKKGDPGSKEWCEANCKPILFGMNRCEDFGTLVITEGQIDSLSCAEAGIKNAVSVPTGKNGFTWVPHCWNWINRFKEIVVFGDYENGEITLSKEIASRFQKKIRIVQKEDYQDCKDANELLQKHGREAIVKAVENAKVKTSAMIRNLADVEPIDLTKLEAIKSKYPSLDEAIMGGFHFGEVIILSGRCGEGKSTFASMCIANAVSQGYKCFCYSGELSNSMFKAWIDMQIAGKDRLTNAEIDRIRNWYNEKIYIYDNSIIENEKGPFEAMEEAVQELSCKFILIDNLMTAMAYSDNKDLYQRQSDFVKQLASFAKMYSVVIMLVAHPRKSSTDDKHEDSNDEISGSGDITNLATVVMKYQRERDGSDYSKLLVTKNRNTGITLTGKNAIKMEYHKESRRIVEYGKDNFDFLRPEEEFTEVIDYENIPFD